MTTWVPSIPASSLSTKTAKALTKNPSSEEIAVLMRETDARHALVLAAVRASESVATRDAWMSSATPRQVVEAESALAELEAELEILATQRLTLRERHAAARKAEAPAAARQAIRALPSALDEVAKALDVLLQARAVAERGVSTALGSNRLMPRSDRVLLDEDQFLRLSTLLDWAQPRRAQVRIEIAQIALPDSDEPSRRSTSRSNGDAHDITLSVA